MAGEPPRPPARQRRRRADPEQHVAAILAAAASVQSANPDASVEDAARAAGVSRQTSYAHFPSREALPGAVAARATAEVTTAFKAAGLREDAARAVHRSFLRLLSQAGGERPAGNPVEPPGRA